MASEFKTHTGETVTGGRLQAALDAVADDTVVLACKIRIEDAYANHVTSAEKDANLRSGINLASAIRYGAISSLSTAQAVNTKLTGLCVPLLPLPSPTQKG